MIRCPRLRRLSKDTEGSVLLETVIAFPVLFVFVLVVMELSMLYNSKQLANYAAFGAARTASVYGINDTVRMHLAAAMAMSSIASPNAADADEVLSAYGLDDPNQTVAVLCSIPGFRGDSAKWLGRLANAYVRTHLSRRDTATAPGKTRKHVTVDLVYIYRCSFLPFGNLWGEAGIDAYCDTLAGLHYDPPGFHPYVFRLVDETIRKNWRWNITIHGRAVTDYWAG